MRNVCFLNRWRQKTLICLSLFSVFVSTISEAAGPPPVITVQPLDQTVPKGGTAIFTVVAVSGTTLSYTWFKDDKKMPGQTARILTINNVGPKDVTGYYVAVKNAGGAVTSRKATLTILNNTTPVANNDTYTTPEDVPLMIASLGILANDNGNGNGLTALLVTNVTHGSLNLNTNGGFTYTPATNFNGSDSFTYRVTAGLATGNVAIVTINVTPVNDPPIAVNDSTNTLEDVSVTVNVLANDSDPEGTPLTITGTSTTNGTAVISGTDVVFTPSTNFNGTVVFSYTVSDGANSATANVTVTVTPVNNTTPVANNDTYTTPEDVPLTIPAPGVLSNDTDVEGDALSALLVSGVTHGGLSFDTNGSFTYTPNTNFNGSDSFTYRVTAGLATGNVATVTINVTPVNDPPIAINDSTNTLEDVSVTINVLANDSDPEGTPLTITGTSTTNGTAVISGTSVVFTPSTNFNGVVVFNYTVSDGTNSATANVTVTVTFVDVARPTNGITSPTANQRWSNAVFTVTGAARDNVGVSNVFLSLNGGGWTTATTANGWTNWSAQVNLTVGTNIVQACAVDAAGNVSTTNTVKFVCILTAPLTVNIVGGGTVVTNYNNQLLQIGAHYAMTAKTNTGFAFVHWTDGDDEVLTNSATLQFVMASNLTFTATFLDVARPTNGITSPTANQRWSNAVFTVTGAARDNVGVANVLLSLNGGGWITATTANGCTNWSAQVSLTPGTNTVQACAVDAAGNVSTTNSVKFVYVTVDWAPGSLNGLVATITPDGQSTFYVGFWTNTFSQSSTDTNNNNGVGTYSYTKLSTNTARLVIAYTSPPTITNGNASLFLTFASNNTCNFSNEINGVDLGAIAFSASANLLPASFNGIKAIFINSTGDQTAFSFSRSSIAITDSQGQVKIGTYTSKQYSQVGAMIVVVQSPKTNYLELTFTTTNYGAYFITTFDNSGTSPDTDSGVFVRPSQSAGGNAPSALTGTNALVTQAGSSFRLSLGATTFTQTAEDTNDNNGAGTYTYTKLGNNTAQLAISYATPPTITNEGGPVFLNFVAPNFCLFTNQDNNGSNYIATISFSAATNLVPASLAGHTVTAAGLNGVVDAVTFNGDGTFTQTETGSENPGVSTGTYTFTTYSLIGGMLQLNFTVGVLTGSIAYVQTTFADDSDGTFFSTVYDSLGDPPSTAAGTFTIH